MRENAAHRRDSGFTLVELVIVLAIIAIVATMALPYLLSSRLSANEKAALGTLRLIAQAQVQFAAAKVADGNNDGTGEHGTFGEMSGSIAVRASTGGVILLKPQLVSPAFRAVSPLGEIVRSGYYFRIYLPDAAGNGVLELPGGGANASIDAGKAESIWCVYAWPSQSGGSGRRVYFTSSSGGITYTESSAYSGAGAPIAPGAAFVPGLAINSIEGIPASNGVGRDGNIWRTLGN